MADESPWAISASTHRSDLERSPVRKHYRRMPRYFILFTHERHEPDLHGEELPDKHAAWKEATVTAGQILQGLDGKLKPERDWRMEVTDEFQNTLYVLHISAEKPR